MPPAAPPSSPSLVAVSMSRSLTGRYRHRRPPAAGTVAALPVAADDDEEVDDVSALIADAEGAAGFGGGYAKTGPGLNRTDAPLKHDAAG